MRHPALCKLCSRLQRVHLLETVGPRPDILPTLVWAIPMLLWQEFPNLDSRVQLWPLEAVAVQAAGLPHKQHPVMAKEAFAPEPPRGYPWFRSLWPPWWFLGCLACGGAGRTFCEESFRSHRTPSHHNVSEKKRPCLQLGAECLQRGQLLGYIWGTGRRIPYPSFGYTVGALGSCNRKSRYP